jgi:leader peptidase (prepilin peptidase)/N-methyltransferase
MTAGVLAAALAVGGLAWGVAADRIAVRWPAHDEEHPPSRPFGWRTVVVAGIASAGLAAVPLRFEGDDFATAAFAGYVAALVLLLATDLDQRILPDLVTLPLAGAALVYAASGRNPLVGADLGPAIAVAVVVPAVLFLASIPFGPGAFGLGDVKLLVSVGLMSGLLRALDGLLVALLAGGVTILALLAARRITRHSFVPFGPFLIVGALWGVLLIRA